MTGASPVSSDRGAVTVLIGVTFPLFAKITVKGPEKHPLYQWLTDTRGGEVKWNFTKFLVGRDGRVLARFGPKREPADLEVDVEKALAG